jgi:hypothetical protein
LVPGQTSGGAPFASYQSGRPAEMANREII